MNLNLQNVSITNALDLIEPRYSRPLDVHRSSEHTGVTKIVQTIWNACFSTPEGLDACRGGPKPKSDARDQLRALILDLFVAWKTDPALSIGVHLSNTAWNTSSRYNALNLSRKIPGLVHRLTETGFIHLSKGSFAGPGAPTNRTARIIAAEPLRRLFREATFGREHISVFSGRECIIMHGSGRTGKEIEYEDTPETNRMREELRAYNALLAKTFIDVPDQELPFMERPIKRGPQQGQSSRVPICSVDNFVRRIFNRGDWSCGGRFFGGWWQNAGSEFRKRIHINDQPTVEVDYQALHIAILSAKHGVEVAGDPYELKEGLIEGMEPQEQRKLIKLLVLMALNAKDRRTACKAFRQDSPTGSRAKSMKDKELIRLLDAFAEKHPLLRDDLCADQGISLMNKDSHMASMIIRAFVRLDIPVLCVHDSFLIDYSRAKQLKTAMNAAAKAVLGRTVDLSSNYLGLDEVEERTPDLVDDYRQMRFIPRCPAYRTRQQVFGERLAYLGLGG